MQTTSILSMLPPSAASLQKRLRDVAKNASAVGDCCRQGYAAVAQYEEMAGLSEAELHRRSIADGDLLHYLARKLGE